MSWHQIYQEMAFSHNKYEMADYRMVHDALVTLHSYLEGQSKAYEVRDMLDYLGGRFNLGMPSIKLREALEIEDEDCRLGMARECINRIEKLVMRNGLYAV